MTGQKKLHSLGEAIANVIVGFGINLAGQWLIFPLLGIPVSFMETLYIAVFFTVISVARTYILRRYFNRMMLALHIKEK